MGINLRLSSSANGTRNLTFNPVIVSTESNIFGMSRSTPTNYHVPGNGNPAVSTSDYYQTFGLYNFRPYDLLKWGSVGATAMAANGGKRYVWCCSADHPSVGAYSWRGGEGFYTGFSDQPSVYPATLSPIPKLQLYGAYNSAAHTISGGYQTYEFPRLVYNPDDADGLPIYLFAECTGHNEALFRSSDFLNFSFKEISRYINDTGGWSSFMVYDERTGTNQFKQISLGTTSPPQFTIWTTTDGINYTNSGVPIYGLQSTPDPSGSTYSLAETFVVGGQRYCIGKEEATGGGTNQHMSIWAVDNTTFDKLASPAKIRILSNLGSNTAFPGPGYMQGPSGFIEDGIVYLGNVYGFVSDINTAANGAGRGGAPYNNGDAGLDHQFIDRIIVRVDDTAARLAAPVQVKVSCVSGVATISWINALPQNTYRLYRGTNATTQATLIGDYTGVTSATDSPSTGRYWYKLVTLDNGTERGNRVVSVYVSSSNAFINEHANRVLDDGCDATTLNFPFMDRADSMLTTNSLKSTLQLFTHPACGVKKSSSVISKVYDLGTTRLPRSMDFKTFTSNTTYSATSVNTGPGWTNTANNAYGFWGDQIRGNTIQKKRQITIIAAYERTTTASDFTFVGTGPIWSNLFDGNKIIKLAHTSGTPGSIEFSLSDATSTKTATVTASGSGMQIAVGTYDGTDMLAYTGTTAGSAVSTLDPNPEFGVTAGGVQGSLAGARLLNASGTQGDFVSGTPSGLGSFPKIYPLLGSGSIHCISYRGNNGGTSADSGSYFNETHAQGKIQCVMVFEKALTSSEIATVVSFLQSTTNW